MIEQGYEGEVAVVVIEDEEGNELYYEEEMVIPYEGQNYAILISLPPEECEEGKCAEEPEIIIARIDKDETGEDVYVSPSDEEFDTIVKIYEEME